MDTRISSYSFTVNGFQTKVTQVKLIEKIILFAYEAVVQPYLMYKVSENEFSLFSLTASSYFKKYIYIRIYLSLIHI